METKPKIPTSPPPAAPRRCLDSQELLRGLDVVEIAHGGQLYLLRVTRENKLILTK